ncbi:uncharacterized protein K460DRAFT_308788 [Cucurbitaria berberidis CBS 394.84]|uniref:Helicase ATP-binding domain-containing protein n=1 Tax=Cucurbitaria berberidis CBS 394.84 TaxID=1168544 RepID=A0A9P4GLD5_9PLEO|nr:uncharacterized protein K460DRAFT_308788 [Cucurbitaria berberidis CBS 394.84]KAF1848463.1 hypothetical protein K460DRAFT_308788 [Cucurbitaria berberidis CBS 394.84]
MAPLLRKRKRQSDIALPALDSDTYEVVLPEKTIDTRSQCNLSNRERDATRSQTTPRALKPTLIPSLASTEVSDNTVPPDCCYHCRTRGGNAAYECFKAEHDDRCTRCIRDKKGKCRMPTDEEAASIAARCPQCTRRGFKNCNGGSPCDTCVRNETPDKCRQPKKRTMDQRQSLRPRRRNSNSNRLVQNDETTAAGPNEQIEQSDFPEDGSMDYELDGNAEVSIATVPARTLVTGSASKVLRKERDIQDLLTNEHRAANLRNNRGATHSYDRLDEGFVRSSEEDTTSETISVGKTHYPEVASDADSKGCFEGPARDNDKDEYEHNIAIVDCDTLPSPPASDESTAETTIKLAIHGRDCSPPSRSTTRPRRSRGRVSYVDLEDDLLEQRPQNEDDDSDVYAAPEDDDESEADSDLELVGSGDEALTASDADTLEENMSEEGDLIEEEPTKTSAKPRKPVTIAKSSQKTAGKGIDLNLPPINNINDVFADMTARAVELGLCEALKNLKGQVINVATMCSGTESPLIALELLSKALEQTGNSPIHFKHHFSAEIEVFKQAFIERNFQPDILFRDIREFIPEGVTTATTAYGAEVSIPSGIDILIAGFVCKDLSRMNNNGKDLDSNGESGDTWRAVYTYVNRFRPGIVLLENVKAKISTWEDVVSRWAKIGYEAGWVYRDSKQHYLPQTRERMYMIAVERSRLGKNAAIKAVGEWKELIKGLQRQCSITYEEFLSSDMMQESSVHSVVASESDWALSRLRYDKMRTIGGLGHSRTLTGWSESGSNRLPDFADRKFYYSQSSRVYDAIEVAHLQAAQNDADSTHKMFIWDVSQNADRFKASLGISSCISPDGVMFTTNRHQSLNGKQLLMLQGMPMEKLLFAGETQRECQDLAGNAMSTTVIGASLISAIISGWKSFRPKSVSAPQLTAKETNRAVISTTHTMKQMTLHPKELGQLNLHDLKQDAVLSARLCNCEGDKSICKASVQRCSACGHTACGDCAGNPKHEYGTAYAKGGRSQTPFKFINEWRPKLPARLKFDAFPDIEQFVHETGTRDQTVRAFVDRIVEANIESQYFCLHDLSRQDNTWKATYNSPQARLELIIGGHDIQWLLFVTCSQDVPGNSSLRKLLKGPVARAYVTESLLDAQWQLFKPSIEHCTLQMSGSAERSSSWKSRLGLVKHKAETVPKTIKIHSNAKWAKVLVGEYDFLAHCGTACGSLYKRSTTPALYMFLDPDPIGSPDNDSFVFSHDCTRKYSGDTRISMAHLEPSWRPWDLETNVPCGVRATLPGAWMPATLKLKSACPPVKASVLSETQFKHSQEDCSQSVIVLNVQLPGSLPVNDFADYSWAFEQAKRLPSFSWQHFGTSSFEQCSCAPTYPRILWNVNEKGMATPHEDRKAAAKFERAMKTRPPIFQIQPVNSLRGIQIQVGINISSLVHRAHGRLAQLGSVITSWRLVTGHEALPHVPFPRFRLLSNTKDTPTTLCSTPKYLRGAQLRSLLWMTKQELGMNIAITEQEEAIHPDLGWRVEARAQITLSVRGGMLADHPSFGKTVTIIGLIQSEFERHTPDALLRQNKYHTEGLPALIDSAATLIVCPPHIASQWLTELAKFLGEETYNSYDILLVDSFARLRGLTIEEIQESRVIIFSWNVFASEEYISSLARFTGMPEPTATNRRAFDAWFSRVADEISGQLGALQKTNFEDFQKCTRNKLKERLQHEDFQAALPIKIQHGSAYQSFDSAQTASRNANGSKTKSRTLLKRKTSGLAAESHPVPLMHMFRFNRIVVDEYHYLNDDNKTSNMLASVSVKRIAAHKRWVLSGTPALANFTDVAQAASYLGITLGRYFMGDGMVSASLERIRKSDQTLVEDFLSQTNVMSREWHQARHQRAQEFLDLFVRQNEAELQHIACSEKLVPIELDNAHRAIYLELSQHLKSQNMQIKRLNNRSSSDKIERLIASLNHSATAEEALLKSALLFETSDGESGLDTMMEKRSDQRRQTEKALFKLMAGFEGLKKDEELTELYDCFKQDAKTSWLGDQDTRQRVRGLLAKAAKTPNPKGFPELTPLSSMKAKQETKRLLSELRLTATELLMRMRSERFISTIKSFVDPSSHLAENQLHTCSAPECKGTANLEHLYFVPCCGHTACEDCLNARLNEDCCVSPMCSICISRNLIKVSRLGSTVKHTSEGRFGEKLEGIAHIIKRIPKEDQGLVFAPNEETIGILENVFKSYNISYHSPSYGRSAAEMMEDFKTNEDPHERKKVLILDLGSESAAGVNLVNANHVIFVSPLLAKTRYEYESAMVQAIARSRRYGQKKKVHIYHVLALHTIDVDVFEHRHRRSDGITASRSAIKLPEASSTDKEKTKLIKNNARQMASVPASWLLDEPKRRLLNVKENPDSFTSLISLSEAFENEDD